MQNRKRPATACAAALVSLLAACAVGPDFQKPAPPDVASYTADPVPAATAGADTEGGGVQHFRNGGAISADWWTLFHSKPLNDLVVQALANNSDLKAAQAALSVARENALAQRGAYYPNLSAGFTASRQQQPGTLAPVPNNNAFQYDLFTPEVTVSYAPDVFGLNRRTVESLEAQRQAVHFQMIATYTTLTSNVVVTAIQQASVETQIDATRQIIASDTEALQILAYQAKKGYANGVDLAAQKTQLAEASATLPPLVKQLAQLHDLLAVLAGRFPGQAPPQTLALADLQLPRDLPLSLPSAVVEQRPDVLQAEANLHAASAQIGIAVANRLPNIQLSANAGSTALAIGQLFTPGTGFWTLAASLTAPIFDGGTLMHQERATRAAYEEAAQQYRGTVLGAFQNVADTLTALEQDAEALKAASAAADAAKTTLDIAQRQVRDGYAGYLTLLNAEQAYQQARINLVQAEASRYADTAALFQALGGGWWNRAELVRNDDDK